MIMPLRAMFIGLVRKPWSVSEIYKYISIVSLFYYFAYSVYFVVYFVAKIYLCFSFLAWFCVVKVLALMVWCVSLMFCFALSESRQKQVLWVFFLGSELFDLYSVFLFFNIIIWPCVLFAAFLTVLYFLIWFLLCSSVLHL